MFLRVRQEAGIFNRLSALEARASKRAQLIQMLYLPLIFLVYGTLLGTVYFQNSNPTFILSAFGVFSCASGLFMFPAIYTYLFRAIEVSNLVHYTNMLYTVGQSLSECMPLMIKGFIRIYCVIVMLCACRCSL